MRRRTVGGRTRAPRTRTGAAWSRGHSGCRRGLHIVCEGCSQRTISLALSVKASACGGAVWLRESCGCYLRQIGHSERRIQIEVVRLYEALEKIPTHLGRLIGALRQEVEDILLLSERGMNGVGRHQLTRMCMRSSLKSVLHCNASGETFTASATMHLLLLIAPILHDTSSRIALFRPNSNLTPTVLF
jgi:hypothetical protein